MSVAVAHPVARPQTALPEQMSDGVGRRGLILSAALHLVVGGVCIFGLPRLFHPPAPQQMPIAVQLVTMGPETRATHPNPARPQAEAKPDVPIPGPPAPKPKPAPAQQTSPPSAAAAPPTPTAPPPPQPPEAKPAPSPPPPVAAIKPAPPPLPPPVPAIKPAPPPPPAKPVARVEARQPKPEPSRQAAREQARMEAKKYDPGQFNALLRNLAAKDVAPPADAPPQNIAAASGEPSSQPRAPLGSQLSASEMDMIREQISRCWNIPAGARDAKDLVVEIRVAVDPDGMVQRATIVDQGRLGDPFFRAAAESARRAFFNPQCRPLRLPPDKYEIWKDMVVDFSPKDLL